MNVYHVKFTKQTIYKQKITNNMKRIKCNEYKSHQYHVILLIMLSISLLPQDIITHAKVKPEETIYYHFNDEMEAYCI